VDYLPENDRVRYTISPDARKEVLKCLLKLNHEIHEQEVKACLHAKGKTKKKQKPNTSKQIKLF
jgi:histone H3/H4